MAMSEQTPTEATYGLPVQLKFTTSGTENEATQINLGSVDHATKVSVRFDTDDGKVAWESSSDTIASAFFGCDADSTYQWTLNRAKPVSAMYVASATATVTVTVTFE